MSGRERLLIIKLIEMKDYQLLDFNESMNVVISNNATEYKPIVIRYGIMYDPADEFRPINAPAKTKKLSDTVAAEAQTMIDNARKSWKPSIKQESAKPATTETANNVSTSTTPQTSLSASIAEAMAKLSVDAMIQFAKPQIDKYISDTYGALPKIIEVKSDNGKNKVTGATHKEFETILKLVNADIPVFLTGPAGCGKNVICKQVAEALGKEFYFSNAVTQEYKITGFIDANGTFHETQFYKAFTQGGIFMLDEIDASVPEVLVILNAAIANRYFDFPNGRVQAHKDFRIVAAGNTFGTGADAEYTGRYQLDTSSLDRFAIVEINYDTNIEMAIARGAVDIVDFVHAFRKAVKAADMRYTVSYRAIERLASLRSVFDVKKAISLAIVRGMAIDDLRIIAKNIKDDEDNEYVMTLKYKLAK